MSSYFPGSFYLWTTPLPWTELRSSACSFIFLGLIIMCHDNVGFKKKACQSLNGHRLSLAWHENIGPHPSSLVHPRQSIILINSRFPVLRVRKGTASYFTSMWIRWFETLKAFSVLQVIVVVFFPLGTPRNRRYKCHCFLIMRVKVMPLYGPLLL